MYAVRVKTVVSTQCLLFLTTENSAGEYHGGNSWWQHEAWAQEFSVCVKKSSSLVFAERPTKFFEPSSLLPLSLCIATVNLAGWPDKQHVL